MREEAEQDPFEHELFLAGGEPVPPGRYKQLDGPHVIELDHEDVLPAALDGRVTCYTRIQTWNDIQQSNVSSAMNAERFA
jgi:hypothetical protein